MAAAATIQELHAAGIGVDIGSVGTGMSSLQVLRQFPIQALKLDRAFIRDLEGRITELEKAGSTDEAAEQRDALRLGRLLLAGHEVTL